MIIDPKNNKIVLTNQEFRRMFMCTEKDEDTQSKIGEKILKPYNLIN